MPAEYEPQEGCVMIWPVRPGSWPNGGTEAQDAFAQIAAEISKSETLWMLADREHFEEVKARFSGNEKVQVLMIPTDDSWARDVGATCVINDEGIVRGIDWEFNAWGGDYNGLYAHWEKDDAAAKAICEKLSLNCYDAHPFVLEGGSIHVDGEGTAIVTESCLLSPGRNPKLTKKQIEEMLMEYLNVEKVIWLPRGIYQDETDEHVDNVCAFVRPGHVVLAWTDDVEDPQYRLSMASLEVLEKEKDALGRTITVHKLPIPKTPIRITEDDLKGYIFEEGEDERELGERLAASYVNFYIANGSILLPQFGDPNDETAVQILSGLFPDREIVGIPARVILVGGGNIHCITQQIPKIRKREDMI